jgi:hypothetical protein
MSLTKLSLAGNNYNHNVDILISGVSDTSEKMVGGVSDTGNFFLSRLLSIMFYFFDVGKIDGLYWRLRQPYVLWKNQEFAFSGRGKNCKKPDYKFKIRATNIYSVQTDIL